MNALHYACATRQIPALENVPGPLPCSIRYPVTLASIAPAKPSLKPSNPPNGSASVKPALALKSHKERPPTRFPEPIDRPDWSSGSGKILALLGLAVYRPSSAGTNIHIINDRFGARRRSIPYWRQPTGPGQGQLSFIEPSFWPTTSGLVSLSLPALSVAAQTALFNIHPQLGFVKQIGRTVLAHGYVLPFLLCQLVAFSLAQ